MANSDMLVRVKADTKNYDANLAKASKTLKQFADNNLSMGGVLRQSTSALTGMAASVLSVTAAIGAAKKVVGDMVRINMQFEQSSSNLAAVLGTSRDQITALTDQAKTLGATTQYTASQILELQANLARLGFNQTEILNSTKAVQAMATAMGADLGEAANLAGSALRGFGLNATEMERVASVLSVGTTKSALSFEKLATALPVVQTAAAKTGFTIEDTVAMLGKLTDNGINAASAATQLRKILNDSTTAGTKLANALGGPVKSFDELVVALDKAGKAGQNHADSVALVNSKNATALDILRDMAQQREVEINGVKTQTSALQELRDSITDCSEGMRGMQDEQLNTLQGSITILNSAWEGLMLTFSESNGVIKTVVDSLSELLQAWTKWRNRRQGGDAAITTFELGINKDVANGYVQEKRNSGLSDSEIKARAEKDKAAIEAERDAAKELYDELAKIDNLKGKEHDKAQTAWNKRFDEMFKGGKYNYNLRTDGNARAYLMRQIAGMNDQAATMGFVSDMFTAPTTTTTTTGGGGGGAEAQSKSRLATLKAQYEEQEKAQIAALDRMAMNEADYEAQVYKIKRETLQKIADLYQEETAEKARANAAISQLDIAYQGTQMRLANKSKTSDKKAIEEYTGTGEYSQKAIAARMSHAKKIMDSSEFGSERYLYEASKIVDLTTLQNLMSEATKRGLTIDPQFIKDQLGQIDMGLGVSDSTWQTLVESLNQMIEESGKELPPIELDVKTGVVTDAGKAAKEEAKSTADAWQNAVAAVNNVGSALQQLEDPAAKVSGIVMQAVANIALGFAQAAASPATGAAGVFGWIAAATAGVATMVSTIAAIKSATSGGFANGGIVPGSSFSGDNLRTSDYGINSGELILNRAQQGAIAGQLNSNPMGNLRLSTEISGSNLRVVLNNDNRQRGGSRGFYSEIH